MDYIREQGAQMLGTRIRRFFERLNGSVSERYREQLGFEQRWFALGNLLADHGPLDTMQAANCLGQSHVAIVQVARAMEQAGLLIRRPDPADRRRKTLGLNDTGMIRMIEVREISDGVQRAAEKLLDEAAPGFMAQLDALDDALDRIGFDDRIAAAFAEKETC